MRGSILLPTCANSFEKRRSEYRCHDVATRLWCLVRLKSLKQWTGEACTVGCVHERVEYGPKDHFCKQTVTFQRRRGHLEEVRCERAFELAQNPSRCQEAVVMTNPECGHNFSMTCYEENSLDNKVAQYSSDADDLGSLESVHEGDASNYRNYGLSLQYIQESTYVRRCGHSKKMKCSEARHMTAECREIVTTKLPTCIHVVHVACYLTKQLSACRPWQERTQSIELLHDESVVVEMLGMPSGACPPALKSILKDVKLLWAFVEQLLILKGKQAPSPCHVRVLKSLKCGHEFTMKCCEDVANSCGAKFTVPCTMEATSVQCTTKTTWRCPRDHLFSLSLCKKGIPSDCPECSSSGLDAAIKDSQRILSSTKLHLGAPAAARILPAMDEVTHIDMNPSSIREFLIRKMKPSNRFKESLDCGIFRFCRVERKIASTID
ncbi:hypothetical protein PsorP6_010756 [Peronosclerospora sorghi]|uniref:Uncharacterized protein n=1 Tax=Peronosclerospora sorghi TaxID=230839 RepID=A0ACC0VX77_9STRA|nr:hypothetical protein PsorP6_010756 [Peronosclerospora sorghi]